MGLEEKKARNQETQKETKTERSSHIRDEAIIRKVDANKERAE